MKLPIRIILSSCLMVTFGFSCFAREWRGIVPLRSTRAEVIKLLGPPRHLMWDYRDYFDVENAVVTFSWIDSDCRRTYPLEPDASIQLNDLVLGISLRLKQPVPERELHLPEGKLYFTDCLGGGAHSSCIFMDDGFSYSTSNLGVTGLSYGPTQNDFKTWEQTHRGCVSSRAGF